MINVYGFFDPNNSDKCLYIGVTDNYTRRINEHIKSLEKGIHKNKSLQKTYNKCLENGYYPEGRLLQVINSDSTLIKFFIEGLYNSLFCPICNRIVISQGRNSVILSRCNKDIAEKLLSVICTY